MVVVAVVAAVCWWWDSKGSDKNADYESSRQRCNSQDDVSLVKINNCHPVKFKSNFPCFTAYDFLRLNTIALHLLAWTLNLAHVSSHQSVRLNGKLVLLILELVCTLQNKATLMKKLQNIRCAQKYWGRIARNPFVYFFRQKINVIKWGFGYPHYVFSGGRDYQ